MTLDWKGCYISSIELAQLDSDKYLSHRHDEDIHLVSNQTDVITVENWNKWYNLYYLTLNENHEVVLVSFTFGDIIDGVDHYYYPESIVRFAKVNNLKIDTISYIAICKMFMEDAGYMEESIPNDVLPTLEDLESVLTDTHGICTSFYLHHLYDIDSWRNYVKNRNVGEK